MMKRPMRLAVTLVAAAAAAGLLAGCGGGDPEERSFDLNIVGRALEGDNTIEVKGGDTVTFNITADEDAVFHLHGYNLTYNVVAGAPTSVTFVAENQGRYEMEVHVSSVLPGDAENHAHDEGADEEDHAHEDQGIDVSIGAFEVRP